MAELDIVVLRPLEAGGSRPVSTAGGAAAGLPGCGVPAADSAGGAAVDSRAPQRTYDHAR